MNVEKTIALMGNEIENKTPHAQKCRANYLVDREKYGDKQSGKYNGVGWEASRNPDFGYWHAYILGNIPLEKIKQLDKIAHDGLNASNGSIGFICRKWDDYVAGYIVHDETVYRGFPYVLSVLKKMIDTL